MQPCIYSPHSVFIPQWIKQLIYATRNSLHVWLQLARLAVKITIVDQASFILMV